MKLFIRSELVDYLFTSLAICSDTLGTLSYSCSYLHNCCHMRRLWGCRCVEKVCCWVCVCLKKVWESPCCSSVLLCGPLGLRGDGTHPAQGNSSLDAAFCSPHGGVCDLVNRSMAAAHYKAASHPAQGWTVRRDSSLGWLRGCREDSTSSYLLQKIPTYQRAWRAGIKKKKP